MGMSDNEDDTEENESDKDDNKKTNSIQGIYIFLVPHYYFDYTLMF